MGTCSEAGRRRLSAVGRACARSRRRSGSPRREFRPGFPRRASGGHRAAPLPSTEVVTSGELAVDDLVPRGGERVAQVTILRAAKVVQMAQQPLGLVILGRLPLKRAGLREHVAEDVRPPERRERRPQAGEAEPADDRLLGRWVDAEPRAPRERARRRPPRCSGLEGLTGTPARRLLHRSGGTPSSSSTEKGNVNPGSELEGETSRVEVVRPPVVGVGSDEAADDRDLVPLPHSGTAPRRLRRRRARRAGILRGGRFLEAH